MISLWRAFQRHIRGKKALVRRLKGIVQGHNSPLEITLEKIGKNEGSLLALAHTSVNDSW